MKKFFIPILILIYSDMLTAIPNTYVLELFSFDGTSLSSLQFIDSNTDSDTEYSVAFNPSGNFIALGRRASVSTTNELEIYSYYGGSLTLAAGYDYSSSSGNVRTVAWDPSGTFLAIGGTTPTNSNELHIIKFDGSSSLSLLASINYGSIINSLSWSPDGKSIALAGNTPGSGHATMEVYSVAYRFDTSTQALTNGINFGNSTLGSSSDLDVFFLAGARVELNGKLFYNNVS
ncbi:hypothetical protein K2W90_00875 [Candidatus Babeliales bacterium]|nr:hypothetical protein [Candidatus Babeliales bacterium]